MTAYVPRQGPPGPQGPPGQLDPSIVDAKGDLLVATGPDTVVRKPVGANGTVLSADSAQADGLAWIVPSGGGGGIPPSIIDAKGDLIVGTANDTAARQAVGANDSVLTADSAQAGGVKWVKVGDSMILAGSNLAKLAAVTGTPNGTKFLRDDGSWQVPSAGGGSLTSQSSVLSADSAGWTATTWTDGPTLSLVAGSYLVLAGATVQMASGGAGDVATRIWDGTNTYATVDWLNLSASKTETRAMATIIVLGSTTTVRLAGWSSRANAVFKAAGIIAPSGNNATYLHVLKFA